MEFELQLVSFEQAKALKELGFPQGGLRNAYYGPNGECVPVNVCSPIDWELDAPTLELAAKWIRKKHNMLIEISQGGYPTSVHCFCGKFKHGYIYEGKDIKEFNSYEEALSEGIDKVIEILKEK